MPVAALLVVTAVMAWHETGWAFFGNTGVLVGIVCLSAALMVVPIPFRSFKQFQSAGTRALYFGSIGGGLLLLALQLPGGTVLFGLMVLYVLQGLGSAVFARCLRSASE